MPDDPGIVCSACGRANPGGSRFCGHCGESLAVAATCPECGEQVPPGSRFCNHCGSSLGAETSRPVPAETKADSMEGERKQITVLFADVRGSMDLAEQLDAESWRELMQRFFQVLADVVRDNDGTVDKFTGDGIMALFGAPIAREDHAQCACRAALEMITGVRELAEEVRADGIELAVRIGLNSGEVVVGTIGEDGMEYTAIGHTVGLAQRMESAAEAGTAYLTASTAALAEGYFELTSLGAREVKGARAPIAMFRLEDIGTAHDHLDVSRARGLSEFVGRETELAELEAALERSEPGNGQVIGVVAGAGVGKSRLCHEFAERCRSRGVRVYHAKCEAHTQDVPLVPVLQLLRSRFGITSADTDAQARERIRGELTEIGLGPGAEEDIQLVSDFLGVPDPDAPELLLNGAARNRRLRDLISALVHATSRESGRVIILEDLQWVDPASEPFLETLVEAMPSSGGVVVANFRPEYHAPWMAGGHYRQLPLSPLRTDSLHDLLGDLLGDDASLDGLADLVVERTGGNPFYVEEVVRELVESGTLAGAKGAYRMAREIDELPVPPTVQSILAARIDRLPPTAKAVLQAMAAVGSETNHALLTQIVDLDADALEAAIRTLIETEFVQQVAHVPEAVFGFRHGITLEVAYGSQLAPARARSHLAVAVGLQAADPDRLEENAGLIAHHYAHAGDAAQATQWHLRAAVWSGSRDPMSSIRHALQVVELEDHLPDGPEADGIRLTARIYVTTMGWRVGADPMVIRRAFDEGVRIAERNDDRTMLILLHASFAACPLTCEGKFAEAKWIATEAARLAEDAEPGLQALSKVYLLYILWLEGRVADAVALCDEITALTTDDPDIPFLDFVGNPRVWAAIMRAPSLLCLGRVDEAHQALEQALALSAASNSELLGWAHMFAATFYVLRPELPAHEMVEHAQASAEIAGRLGDAFSRSWSRYWTAHAALRSGRIEEAIDGFNRALEEIHDRGAGRESESLIRSHLAVALVAAGRPDDGIAAGREAVDLAVDQALGLGELWSRESLAGLLLDRAHAGDFVEAMEHLTAARALAERCDQVVFLERIGELERRLPATT